MKQSIYLMMSLSLIVLYTLICDITRSLLHRFIIFCLERRMAETENTRVAARINETRRFYKGSYGILERSRASVTSVTGDISPNSVANPYL